MKYFLFALELRLCGCWGGVPGKLIKLQLQSPALPLALSKVLGDLSNVRIQLVICFVTLTKLNYFDCNCFRSIPLSTLTCPPSLPSCQRLWSGHWNFEDPANGKLIGTTFGLGQVGYRLQFCPFTVTLLLGVLGEEYSWAHSCCALCWRSDNGDMKVQGQR